VKNWSPTVDASEPGRFIPDAKNEKIMAGTRKKNLITGVFLFLVFTAVVFSGCVAPARNAPVTPVPSPTISVFPTQSATPLPVVTGIIAGTGTLASSANSTPVTSPTANQDFKSQGSVSKSYYYIIDGTPGYVPIEVYTGVSQYITTLGHIYTGDDYSGIISNEVQREYISSLVEKIRDAAKNPDDEARIAISLVQHIKYDANYINEFQYDTNKRGQKFIGRYPYTILYENWGGICGEKSFLLALLLKELGYGVALFEFDTERHMALGIKVPATYAYRDTGYALIESTSPIIPTYDNYVMTGGIRLTSTPKVVPVSEGKVFGTIDREYADARLLRTIDTEADKVSLAAGALWSAEQRLDALWVEVEYWKSQVESSRTYEEKQYNQLMYNNAYAAYKKYYDETYLPKYVAWRDLYNNFQDKNIPKMRDLEKKYGMNTGISVGL
jgi:hypothetical protein